MRVNAKQIRNKHNVQVIYDERLLRGRQAERLTFKGLLGVVGVVAYFIAMAWILAIWTV